MTGTKINFTCSIENFSHREGEKDIGDRDFDLTLKEYQTASPRKIKQKENEEKRPSKPAPKCTPSKRRYALAHRRPFYGNSQEWRKIWNANKQAMIKRSKRNIKQPGHWIFPGQKLKIP